MYDIQTLFSVPEGFSSKAIVTTLRAFGDKTNTMSLKPSVSKHAKADCGPPPRFPSQKASATVALTSTTALRSWKPLSSTPPDALQREGNAVPFPTTPACEQIPAHDPPPGLKRPLPVEARRRRSGAVVPPSARASTTVLIRPVAKRPRKSRRVLADLQFMASVHRSIVAFHAGSRRHEALDTGVDAMHVDGAPGSRDSLVVARVKKELRGLDQQLVARLVLRLRAGGFASTLMDARPTKELSQLLPSPLPLEGTRAPPPSPEMDSGVDAMDVTPDLLPASPAMSSHVFRLPPVPTVLPPPPPPLLDKSVPPCSPPGLVSPRVPPEVPTEKLIYTMPQLVATHLLRFHERGGVRTPSSHPRTPRARSPLSKSLGP